MVPVDLKEKAVFLPNRPGTQLVHGSENMRVVVFALRAGQEVPAHVSPSEVLMHVVSGRGTFLVTEGTRKVAAGDLVVCAPNEPHGMAAAPDEDLIVLAVIAPSP